VDCQAERKVTAATEVHHIAALRYGGTHEDSNLMALCKSHHSSRTAAGA
jgi:5-methylcytosine-specific restriction protein A